MMKAKEIDLSQWILKGGGAEGDSFYHVSNPEIMLKLFSARIGEEMVRHEVEIALSVKRCGVPSPEPGELVKADGRYGIVFQRIQNKKSFCRAIADDPSCLKEMARRMSDMGKCLHSKEAADPQVVSCTEHYARFLNENTTVDSHTREVMQRCLDDVRGRDTRTLLHGDYHFGNVITDGVKDYFIDLGCFGYGHPDFDNSMLYLNCFLSSDEMIHHYYHISEAQAREFWREYKKLYYGPDAPSDEDFMRRFAPFLLLRSLLIEVMMGVVPPLINLRKVSMDYL